MVLSHVPVKRQESSPRWPGDVWKPRLSAQTSNIRYAEVYLDLVDGD